MGSLRTLALVVREPIAARSRANRCEVLAHRSHTISCSCTLRRDRRPVPFPRSQPLIELLAATAWFCFPVPGLVQVPEHARPDPGVLYLGWAWPAGGCHGRVAVGDGHVPVHRCRGLDTALGRTSRCHATSPRAS